MIYHTNTSIEVLYNSFRLISLISKTEEKIESPNGHSIDQDTSYLTLII